MIPRLLAISPGDHRRGADVIWRAEALARVGVRGIVLREPQLGERELVDLIRNVAQCFQLVVLHARCRDAEERARALGLGLHLPGGADVGAVRARFGGVLGYSAHSPADAEYAGAAEASYCVLSPVATPHSKPEDARPPLGVEGVAEGARRSSIPVLGLGGVTPALAHELRRAGVHGVAAMGGLFGSTPEECARRAEALLLALG